MKNTSLFTRTVLAGMAIFAIGSGVRSAIAVEFPNGQTAFDQSPRLLKTSTSNRATGGHATYRFTIKLPEGAGVPLKAIKLEQQENIETIQFREQASRAFAGTRTQKRAEITLASVGGRSKPGVETVVFDQPIQPGNTVTISVTPKHNPHRGGIYQFGVTAFPDGPAGRAQFLGYGRVPLQTYKR